MESARYYLPEPRKESDEVLLQFTDKNTGELCRAKIKANIQQTEFMTLLTVEREGLPVHIEFLSSKGIELVKARFKQKSGRLW